MMATPNAEGSIRKTRSTGDIPRTPERAHLHSNLPIVVSEARPPPHHHDTLPTSFTVHSLPSANHSQSASLANTSSSPYPVPPPPVALATHDRPNPPASPPVQRIRPPTAQERPNTAGNPQRNSIYMRLLLYLGLGRNAPHARKALVSLIWTVSWDVAQIIVITTMLILVGTHFKSPTKPSLSEWKACDRPLGTWASIWVVRVILALILAVWEYYRDTQRRAFRQDLETADADGPPSAGAGGQENRTNLAPQHTTHNGLPDSATPPDPILPYSGLYSRLTLISSLLTLSWFLTAHILEYSSVNSCRHASPHLWWLVFGVLCIMYLMVLEVVLLGIIVLVIAPILFVFWNIFLICLGRHPLQNPHMIKPEIGGLSKSVVERIPLVMYIPSPPEDEKRDVQNAPHIYPPKTALDSNPPQQKRFRFLHSFRSRQLKKSNGAVDVDTEKNGSAPKDNSCADEDEPISWEDNWEKTDYPFVALENNRAACAICLVDFEEPKRKHPLPADDERKAEGNQGAAATEQGSAAAGSNSPTQRPNSNISEEDRRDPLKLEDAGEGAQPLRLLACGHVFHKTCLDPWLIDVSGRCPICQKAVEVPKTSKKSRPFF